MANQLKPFINIGPGHILKREMEALNWNQEDLAQVIGMSAKSINQILNNKQRITVDTAILLGKAFKTSPELWLNLEKNYRLRLKTEGQKEKDTELKAKIRMHMPMLEMRKKGWLNFDNSTKSQKKAYCKFWEQDEPDFSIYENSSVKYCARQAKENETFTDFYTQTWLKKAQIEADKINEPAYNKKKLQEILNNISNYANNEEGIKQFLYDLNSAGVKFFILSHLEKTYLDGAAFISGENPVVVFTNRHKGIDSFWWTITHELAHVLLHLENEDISFLDNLDAIGNSKIEIEADEFTAKLLKKDEIIHLFKESGSYLTEQRLLNISHTVDLHPAIVLGILQFEKLATYRTKLNDYKKIILDLIHKEYIKG